MLIANPVSDRSLQEEYCKACGAVYDPEFLMFAAEDNGELLGIFQFSLSGATANVTDIRPRIGVEDFEGMFILTRGALNYIDLCGIHHARCTPETGDLTLIRAVGFKEIEKGLFDMDLTDQFTGKCTHCK